MALSLDSITCEARVKAPRIVVLGVEKIGKSCFATGCRFEGQDLVAQGLNSPIVLPMTGEEGVDDLAVPSFPKLASFDQVMEALGVLYQHPSNDYRTVVIDSVSALEPLVWDHVCKKHSVLSIEQVGGGYGKGYLEAATCFRELLGGIDALRNDLNLASVLIAHVKIKRFDDPEGGSFDTYQMDCHDRIAHMIYRWADCILFCNTKVVVKQEDQGFGSQTKRGIDAYGGRRFLFSQKRPAHPGGGRGVYGQLPYELPLDWSAFEAAVDEAMQRRQ